MKSRGDRLAESGSYVAAIRELTQATHLYRRLLSSKVVMDLLAGPSADQGADWFEDSLADRRSGILPLTRVREEAGAALWRLANVTAALLDLPRAMTYATEAAELISAELEDRAAERDPLWSGIRHQLAVCLTDLSIFSCAMGALAPAIEHAHRATELLTDAVDDAESWPPDPKPQLATACHVLAQALLAADAPADADAAVRSALAIREQRASSDGPRSLASYELANSLLLRSRIAAALGHRKAAVTAYTRGVELAITLGDAADPVRNEAIRLTHHLNERFPGCLVGNVVHIRLQGQ